ncbi:MAG: ABC transporter ATP-binding protein [Burkholderiaceae bacterium]
MTNPVNPTADGAKPALSAIPANAAQPANVENPILRLANVSLAFGGLQALNDVSFTVIPQEMIGLIGPNGAGKTTCLRTIAGLLSPDSGALELNGVDVRGFSIDQRVVAGMALTNQIVRPLRTLTVLDNVALAWGRRRVGGLFRSLLRSGKSEARDAAGHILGRVGIEDYALHLATNVPLGVLKRLEVARAIALEPGIVFFDEPLAGLNHVEAGKLADLILSLNRDDGLTVVLVEHNLREVVRICDRLIVLETGAVLADGTAKTVIREPAVITAYVGEEASHA